MGRRFIATLAALALVVPAATPVAPAYAQKDKNNWDGLVRVKAKRLDAVYLLPQADFRGYTKVLIEPSEVAFRKNWQRDQNSDAITIARRVSDEDARKILDAAQAGFDKEFREAYVKAGYQVVDVAGPDVLRIRTAVINLDVQAPDIMTAGRTRTFSREAGGATLVLEVRDSLSGQLLGRGLDSQTTGDFGPYLRNSVTNTAEFENLFADWAKISARGLDELKALSPIDANGKLAKR